MLWLTQLDQKGADVTIEGRCMALTALSDFVDNLGAVGLVQEAGGDPGQPGRAGQAGAGELIRFTIKAQVAPPAG